MGYVDHYLGFCEGVMLIFIFVFVKGYVDLYLGFCEGVKLIFVLVFVKGLC